MRHDHLSLLAACLTSKWGFNDGDCPDEVYAELEHRNRSDLIAKVPWRRVLAILVRDHLAPRVSPRVTVGWIFTCHNPIRAFSIEGMDDAKARDWWIGRETDHPDRWTFFTPPEVAIPWETVIATFEAELARSDMSEDQWVAVEFPPRKAEAPPQ